MGGGEVRHELKICVKRLIVMLIIGLSCMVYCVAFVDSVRSAIWCVVVIVDNVESEVWCIY